MDERLQKQLNFILEIDKEKNIFRQTHLSGHGRRENDAEHAWHMAVMAYLLQEYSNEPVDVARVMLMCLLHDVVEIDAGDTYAYDADGLKTQKAREDAAKQRIYSLLPDDQKRGLMAVFDEFEADETAEAHFAHAMDNLQPLLLNNSNGGSDWADHDVTAKQVYGRQSRTEKGSADLYELTPEQPYTSQDLSYNNDACRASQEQKDPAARPRIAGQPLDLSQYGTIYLGYPIWWGTAPRIINTFLDTYDLTGKTIRPFCTSGSSGIETSVADIRAAAPEVNVTAGLRVDDPDGSALKAWVLG